MQSSLLFVVGAATGPIYDVGHLRALLCAGAFLMAFGMMMTSICKTYWQTFLAQGIVIGLGNGCVFLASIAIIGQYFTTRKSFATGIASVGSSIG
jgi:MFS family permease